MIIHWYPDFFVIWVVFFNLSAYNKNVIKKHEISNKSVKECDYLLSDFEMISHHFPSNAERPT